MVRGSRRIADALSPAHRLHELWLERNGAGLGAIALCQPGDWFRLEGECLLHERSGRLIDRADGAASIAVEHRVQLLATTPTGLLRPGAEIDLRLYASPPVDAAFRNVATTPALEALCSALRRPLRLVSLQLHGNGFGEASRAALSHAAADGPMIKSLRLQLVQSGVETQGLRGGTRDGSSEHPEALALVDSADDALLWASDAGLASGVGRRCTCPVCLVRELFVVVFV